MSIGARRGASHNGFLFPQDAQSRVAVPGMRSGRAMVGCARAEIRREATKQYVGLVLSQTETAVCVVDQSGKNLLKGKVPSDPGPLARVIHKRHAIGADGILHHRDFLADGAIAVTTPRGARPRPSETPREPLAVMGPCRRRQAPC